jgi:hypothetical protein
MEFIKSNLFTVASDIRYFLLTGIKTLPLTVGGTLLILGLTTANYAMLFFIAGLLVLAPTAAFVFNLFVSFLFEKQGLVSAIFGSSWVQTPMGAAVLRQIFSAQDKNVCNVASKWDGVDLKRDGINTFVSYWTVMTFFFIGYLVLNAVFMYLEETKFPTPENGSTDSRGNPVDPDAYGKAEAGATNRRTQAAIAFVALAVLIAIILYTRGILLYPNACDGPAGLLFGLIIGGALGCGWYYLLSRVGDQRLSDLFGIANRLLIPMATVDKPYACLPQNSHP